MPAPTVTSVKASIGPLAGGTLVEVTGTGFLSEVAVKFDGTLCTGLVLLSSTSVICTTPLHSAGAVTVTATNSDNQSGSLSPGYTYQAAPTVTSVTASSGATAGGTVVAVTGTGFLPGVGVTFGGLACKSTSGTLYFDSTWLSCWTPPHIAGAVKVTATNTDTQTGSYSSYTYQAAPTVTLVTASSGALDGGTLVTVKGAGFLSGVGVTFDGTACTTLTLTSSTELTCTTPAHSPGPVTVRATNTDGQGGSLYPGYTYQAAPTVTSVSPPNGPLEGGTSVDITGTGFLSGVKVTIGSAPCTDLDLPVFSTTSITCKTPASDTDGAKDVVVTNSDTQFGTLAEGYTYLNTTTTTTTTTMGATCQAEDNCSAEPPGTDPNNTDGEEFEIELVDVIPYPPSTQEFITKLLKLSQWSFVPETKLDKDGAVLTEDPSVFFTKTEFMAAITGFAQLAPELKGSIQFSYQWLGDQIPGTSRFFAFKFGSRIYIFKEAYPPYGGRLTNGKPLPFESYFQYRGWYAETWLDGNGLSAAQEWVDTKINEPNWLASPLHPANRAAAYKIAAEILFPPTLGIESIQAGDWQRGIPQFAAGTIMTVFGYGLIPFKAAAPAIVSWSAIESAVIFSRPESKLWDYLGPVAQTAFFLPYVATFKLIKGRFTSPSVPIEKMGEQFFAKNFFQDWNKDKPYVILGYIREKISRGLDGSVSPAEMKTIEQNYMSITKHLNPDGKSWTPDIMRQYFVELEQKVNAGYLWSAENKEAKYVFKFVPNDEIIKVAGVTTETLLYHTTISVAYAPIRTMKLTPGTATLENMGPVLRKLFPTMLDNEITELLNVVKTLDKTKFLNPEPLFRVSRVFPGNPVTSIEEGIVASSSMPEKVAKFLEGQQKVNVFRFEPNKFHSQIINGEGKVYEAGTTTWGRDSCQANEKVVFMPKNYTITKVKKEDGFECFTPLPNVEYFYFRVTVP